MARLWHYTRALASGYVALGANIAYTLASVPLALAYLGKEEFGLWALTAQVAGYMALVDLGMSGASRVLIDHKDQRDGGDYGSVIQTMFWVSVTQSLMILAASVAMALGLSGALGVPRGLEQSFFGLLLGQGALLAGTFLTRLLTYLLNAHQRYDIANYAQMASFAASYGVLWLAFASGQGVFAMLWGQVCGWLVAASICLVGCARQRLFPAAGCWGRPTWERFGELFRYGRDIFLFFLGSQLINASQTILLARVLGLEAAAVWSVCTRAFMLALQMVYRVFDFSCAALAEMIVRQEWHRLRRRFQSIVSLSTSLAVIAAVVFSACNQDFVRVWTGGRMAWPAVNDTLLSLWLVVCVVAHAHVGLVGQTKQFGLLPYLCLLEGLCFVAVTLLVLRSGGVTAMVGAALGATLLFTLPYGLWRSSRLFGLPFREIALGWARPALRLLLVMAPTVAAVWLVTRPLGREPRLAVMAAVLAPAGLACFVRFGMEDDLRRELLARCPGWLRSRMKWLCGRHGTGEPSGEENVGA